MNEKVAKDANSYSHEQYAQCKQFLQNKNFNVADFERSIKNLKECPKMLREQNQQYIAPGKKFGIFGGNKQLTDESFQQQVYSSGNQAQTLKRGKKNERDYYSKLISKVKLSANSFKYDKNDYEPEILQLPLRDCKV